MPQYIVICRMLDPLDPALQRKRAELRPAHIEGASKLQAEGKLLLGGMVQDEAGNPAGSGCICNFDNEAALWEWLDNDPWMLGGVWHSVEVIPFKVAEHYLKH